MNSITGAFSLYEVFRILVPGLYCTLMLGERFISSSQKFTGQSIDTFSTLIFIITAIVLGALFYAMDIPRWFKKWYSTLPSNLIIENIDKFEGLDKFSRKVEDSYFRFYYSLPMHTMFKTEIQSGIFHLLMTMSFIGILTIIIHLINMTMFDLISEYYYINIFITVVSVFGAIVIYKSKLRHTWQRNYLEYFDDYQSKKEIITK